MIKRRGRQDLPHRSRKGGTQQRGQLPCAAGVLHLDQAQYHAVLRLPHGTTQRRQSTVPVDIVSLINL